MGRILSKNIISELNNLNQYEEFVELNVEMCLLTIGKNHGYASLFGNHVGNCMVQMFKGDLFIKNNKNELNANDYKEYVLSKEDKDKAINWIQKYH